MSECSFGDTIINLPLEQQLAKSVDYLDLPNRLIETLKGLGLNQIRDVLAATEEKYKMRIM